MINLIASNTDPLRNRPTGIPFFSQSHADVCRSSLQPASSSKRAGQILLPPESSALTPPLAKNTLGCRWVVTSVRRAASKAQLRVAVSLGTGFVVAQSCRVAIRNLLKRTTTTHGTAKIISGFFLPAFHPGFILIRLQLKRKQN